MWSLLLAACAPAPTPPSCPPPPPRPAEVRVRRLACAADLPTGAFAAARIGDWVLENATSRWVVRDGTEGHALVGLAGGNLVDAVRMDEGVQQGEDGLRELAAAVGFHVLVPDTFTPGPDSLEVTGTLAPFPLVTDVLPVARPTSTVRWEYVLAPFAPVLELRAHLDGAPASLSDLVLVRGGQQLFVPGEEPWDLPLTSDADALGILTPDPALGPAVATRSDAPRTLLYAGPIRVVLHEAREGTVTRWWALGADHAEAAAWLDPDLERWDNDAGLVDVRDADGRTLSRCRSETCAVPDGADALVPIWLGDGNGGPGGPGQDGAPARLRITAPTAFRVAGTRDDGLERVGLDVDGDGTFSWPAGTWDLWIGAGPTFTRHLQTVTLAAGQEVTVAADLREVVDTTGWTAADLHVHLETSLDSDVTTAHRLAGIRAEHLGYVVTTDHDFVATLPEAEGVVLRAAAEVSTMLAGHYNAWPVEPDPDAAGHGAFDWRGLEPEQVVDALPGRVQCNHPRFVDGGYAASFDVGLAPERCDLVEVLNGYSPAETPQVLDDLLGAWAAGHAPVATGASDSHDDREFVGNPRTWIRAEGDADTLDAALDAGRAVASGGPFVTLALTRGAEVAQIGDTLPPGPATAVIDLQAPDWMPLGELVLLVDGAEAWTGELSGLPAVDGLRHRRVEVPVDPARFVVVVHRGAPAAPPGIHAPPDVVTNPVWLGP